MTILTDFNEYLPAQERIRVKIDHGPPTTCKVFLDFSDDSYLYSYYYTTNGVIPTDDDSITFPYNTHTVDFDTTFWLLRVNTSTGEEYTHRAFTPRHEFADFKFDVYDWGECDGDVYVSSGYDWREDAKGDGRIYVVTMPQTRTLASFVVYAIDSQTVCYDRAIFYSLDGTDPYPYTPGVNDPRCITLTNTLVNYEVITAPIGANVWLENVEYHTQADGGGCEGVCQESVAGSYSWRFSC